LSSKSPITLLLTLLVSAHLTGVRKSTSEVGAPKQQNSIYLSDKSDDEDYY